MDNYKAGDKIWITRDPRKENPEYERAVIKTVFEAGCIVRLRDAYGERMVPWSCVKEKGENA